MQRCLPGYTYPHNAREGYHLHVVLSGKGILRTGGQEFQIRAGQMFVLKDREEAFYQADMQDPWHYVWVTYSGFNALRYIQSAGFEEGIYVQDCNLDSNRFAGVVREILERPHLNISSEVYRTSLALRFLSLAIESYEVNEEGTEQRGGLTTDEYVEYAIRFIEMNFASVRISDVAEYIGVNRTYFTSIFKKKMMVSPQEYLMSVRMSKSKELLRRTDVPINVVAREVGYEDQLAFSKMFRKKYGLSPEQYRKQKNAERTIEQSE
ncbi:MAG: AraC family transcriptional regulator [Clostridia bacterium]|nr:AraC family transcriptional regulator [Clostridia bacterium]